MKDKTPQLSEDIVEATHPPMCDCNDHKTPQLPDVKEKLDKLFEIKDGGETWSLSDHIENIKFGFEEILAQELANARREEREKIKNNLYLLFRPSLIRNKQVRKQTEENIKNAFKDLLVKGDFTPQGE